MQKTMKVYDIKDMIAHLMITIEKLDSGQITVQEAMVVSKLHNTAQGWLNYDLKNNVFPVEGMNHPGGVQKGLMITNKPQRHETT